MMNLRPQNSHLHIRFEQRFGPEFFKRIPESAGVFWLLNPKRQMLLVSQTHNLRLKLLCFRENLSDICEKKDLELIKQIHEINWTECHNLASARLIAKELRERHQPQYQLQSFDLENYMFFSFHLVHNHLSFHITEEPEPGPFCFGAFKAKPGLYKAVSSLGRLLYFYWHGGNATSWPLQLTKNSAQRFIHFDFSSLGEVEQWNWRQSLEGYFKGESLLLTRKLRHRVTAAKESVDLFTFNWLYQDLSLLEKFYNQQAKRLAQFKNIYKIQDSHLAAEWMAPFRIARCAKH